MTPLFRDNAGNPVMKEFIVHPTHRRNAFTLIEILVVISIIVILIALLLPVLIRSKESAGDIECMTNTGQLVNAQLAHATDRRGEFTPHAKWDAFTVFSRSFGRGDGTWSGTAWNGWTGTGLLYYRDYVSKMIAWCPVNTSEVFTANNAEQGFRGDPWSEGLRWMGQSYHQRRAIDRISNTDFSSASAMYADVFTHSPHYSPPTGRGIDVHHGDGFSVAFLDGAAHYHKDVNEEITKMQVPGGKGGGTWDDDMEVVWKDYLSKNGANYPH